MKFNQLQDISAAALNGDSQMLNILFNRYRPQVYSVALRILGNTPAAEDAVQEAFITAYTHLGQLKNPDAFLPWLKKITANCCYQLLRKEKPLNEIPENMQLIDNNIERHFEQLSMRDAIYTALSFLPEALRHTVILRYLSEFNTYTQIAAITGVPVGTVRSRLSEGKKQLIKHWNNHQHADESEFKNAQYWNGLYTELMPGVYHDIGYLPTLLNHIDNDMNLVFTSGKTVQGRNIFKDGIYDDFEHGSCISAVNSCISSGDLTVMHVSFQNSPEHPNHCPPGSYLTFYRENGIISRMRFYHALRTNILATSQYA